MKLLEKTMSEIGLDYNESMIESFYNFRRLVLEWNNKVNLTAIKDPDEFEAKHFADSVLAFLHIGFKNSKNIIDIGTGAGFPGIPLAICFPNKHFVLVDSLNKRIKILNEIINKLNINNAVAIHSRAEDLAFDTIHREKYDICLSRAVAPLDVLSEYCLPFIRTGGFFGAYKTEESLNELDEAHKAIKTLGGRYDSTTGLNLEGLDNNHLIFWVEKISKTPTKYPRKAGTPTKNPIK